MHFLIDDVFQILGVDTDCVLRDIIVARIDELARQGLQSDIELRDRILREAQTGRKWPVRNCFIGIVPWSEIAHTPLADDILIGRTRFQN